MDNRIIELPEKKDCCGCGACGQICPKRAIAFSSDSAGFSYPHIDIKKCVRCGLCLRTCPIKRQDAFREAESAQPHVKILNLHMTRNYGASIAAACLEGAVRRIVPPDYIVQTIHYENEYSFSRHPIRRISEKIKDKEGVGRYLRSLFATKPQVNTELRTARFETFHVLFLNRTPPMDNVALKTCTDNDVALICGSDVIWHTKRISSHLSYAFGLNFGKKETARIAFAPSIDCCDGKLLRRKKRLYRKRLKRLDSVSVRERESRAFLQDALSKDVTVCCDPAFLYTEQDFEPMIAQSQCVPVEKPYLYVYILDENAYVADYAKKIAAEKGLKICYYAPNYQTCFSSDDVCCNSDGPSEFLYRLRAARYVVTTSYHCVVFSLIFRKAFLAFTRSCTSVKTPDLLNTVGLSDRLIRTNETKNIDDPIDFDAVQQTICGMRENALSYLKNALPLH